MQYPEPHIYARSDVRCSHAASQTPSLSTKMHPYNRLLPNVLPSTSSSNLSTMLSSSPPSSPSASP